MRLERPRSGVALRRVWRHPVIKARLASRRCQCNNDLKRPALRACDTSSRNKVSLRTLITAMRVHPYAVFEGSDDVLVARTSRCQLQIRPCRAEKSKDSGDRPCQVIAESTSRIYNPIVYIHRGELLCKSQNGVTAWRCAFLPW